jgi:hypothetical protein
MSNSTPTTATKPAPLRTGVRVLAAGLFVATVGFWTAKGAHTGWSMNQVPVKQIDEITEIEFVTYEKRFVPGIEFLGGGVGFATWLFVVSLLFKRKTTNPSS